MIENSKINPVVQKLSFNLDYFIMRYLIKPGLSIKNENNILFHEEQIFEQSTFFPINSSVIHKILMVSIPSY